MKKVLVAVILCMMSVATFAKSVPCTAHYTLVILEEGMPNRTIHVDVTSSGGCASALKAARLLALAQLENLI